MKAGWGPYSRIHDPMAVAITLDKGFADVKKFYCDVETKGAVTYGMTVVDQRPKARATWVQEGKAALEICCAVDGERFIDFFLNRMKSQK